MPGRWMLNDASPGDDGEGHKYFLFRNLLMEISQSVAGAKRASSYGMVTQPRKSPRYAFCVTEPQGRDPPRGAKSYIHLM